MSISLAQGLSRSQWHILARTNIACWPLIFQYPHKVGSDNGMWTATLFLRCDQFTCSDGLYACYSLYSACCTQEVSCHALCGVHPEMFARKHGPYGPVFSQIPGWSGGRMCIDISDCISFYSSLFKSPAITMRQCNATTRPDFVWEGVLVLRRQQLRLHFRVSWAFQAQGVLKVISYSKLGL